MLVPKINPDEFGPGYLIRLGLVNGLTNQKEVIEEILKSDPSIEQHQNVIAYLLSSILGQKIEDYCKQHTLVPIYRSITNIERNISHGSLDYKYGVLRFGHWGLIKHLKVCKSCIKEDIDYLGYSYYRRSHQIPGARYCSKHGSSKSGYLYTAPKEIFCNPDEINKRDLKPLQQYKNEYLVRIQMVLEGLCQFSKPTDPNKLTLTMQAKAKKLKLRWCTSGRSELFSDYFIRQLPAEWLVESQINTASKVGGVRSGSIDGVLSNQNNSFQAILYVASYALLFDDADEILRLIGSASETPLKLQPLKEIENGYWHTDGFLDVYISQEGSLLKISGYLGVSENVISRGLEIAELPTLGLYQQEAFKALNLFQGGLSIDEASKKTGVPIETIEPLLRVAYRRLTSAFKSPENIIGKQNYVTTV